MRDTTTAPPCQVRPERPVDGAAIRAVVAASFGRDLEADIVEALRQGGYLTLSLVATAGENVIGHAAFSPVRVDGAGPAWAAIALGPLAVAPDWQRLGVGSALARAGLERCHAAGHNVVFVLGHPTYYPRFGFRPTVPLGVACEFPVPEPAFMVAELAPHALHGRQGTVRYAPPFRTG